MKTASCLILELSDFTKGGNLKTEPMDALVHADLVLMGSHIVKNRDGAVTASLSEALASSKPPKKETPPPTQADPEEPTPSTEDNSRTPDRPEGTGPQG